MLEENLKRGFKIFDGKFTESLLTKLGGDKKNESIERDQENIGMLNPIKGVMFKFDGNKKSTHAM